MPDQGAAEILQILGGQARKHAFIDFIRAERRLVLLEPERPQPFPDIHRRHASMIPVAAVSYAFAAIATGERRCRGLAYPPRAG